MILVDRILNYYKLCPIMQTMNHKPLPFWKTKTLKEMTRQEWESLCSGCGICCLHRFHNQKTGKVFFTSIACKFLDTERCHCTVYERRFQQEPDCEEITPDNLITLKWLPKTCGYRSVADGRDLEWWHPLISGDPDTVHQADISMQNKVISEENVQPGDVLKYMIKRPSTFLFYDFS